MTNENVNAPWLNFEAGVLSHSVNVTTFFVDSTQRDLAGPLTDLQRTWFDKDDVRRLVGTINSLADAPLTDGMVSRAFEKWWPELEAALNAVLEFTKDAEPVKRSPEDMLEEMLGLLRGQRRASPDNIGVLSVRQIPPPSPTPPGPAAEARSHILSSTLQANSIVYSIPLTAWAVEPRYGHLILHVDPNLSPNDLLSLTQAVDMDSLSVTVLRDLAPPSPNAG